MNTKERMRQFDLMMGHIVSARMKEWLIGQGFFTAPASTKHHGACEGGLFDHSCQVAKSLMELTDKLELDWKVARSPFLIGMFHDICKNEWNLYSKAVNKYPNVFYTHTADMIASQVLGI